MAKAGADRQGCAGRKLGRFRQPARRPIATLPEAQPDDICYLQYSSGSTRFPTGVAVTHRALLHNLRGHATSMQVSRTTAWSAGCRGITTWGWSAASSR